MTDATKGTYMPANTRDSQKFDATFRQNFTIGVGCTFFYLDHPCPHSDMPSGTLFIEAVAGAFGAVTFRQAAGYANVLVVPMYNNSEYTFGSTDNGGAMVRYVGSGVTMEHIGNHTTRYGIFDAIEKIGDDDPIFTQADFGATSIANQAAAIIMNQKARHCKWQQEGLMEFSHLNHDEEWYQYANGGGASTLAAQKDSPAYTCAGNGWKDMYGVVALGLEGCDPTFAVHYINNTGVGMTIQLKGCAHFERTSEDFPHKHSLSHDFATELGRVLPAYFTAKKSHASDPDTHISSIVAQKVAEHARSRTAASGAGKLLAAAARTAAKPKNLSVLAGLAMALA